MAEQPAEEQDQDVLQGLPGTSSSVVIHVYNSASERRETEKKILKELTDEVRKLNLELFIIEVDCTGDKSVSKVIEKHHQNLKYMRVILAFPDERFYEGQLVETVNVIMKRSGQDFVTIILHHDQFLKLPTELSEMQLRWVTVGKHMSDISSIASDLQPFLQELPKTIDLSFLNAGTGLAWSYYFGYLWYILPEFEENIQSSTWRTNNPQIPDDRISKTMYIVFTTNCREPKIMNSERIIFNINKLSIERAGLSRNYDFDIREVKSKDGNESYYGVVYFLNIVQGLSEMRDDPNKNFVKFSEEDMRHQGRYCFEKLKLFMKYTYNEKIKIDHSKYDFIEFNTKDDEKDPADENDLADEIFNRMKQTCTSETKTAIPETGVSDSKQVGILYHSPPTGNIKDFVDKLENAKQISQCSLDEDRVDVGLKIIKESHRIFMVLTDDFVMSPAFEKWFYIILDKGYAMKNRRFLVCLNCLSDSPNNPKVLDLQLLFSCISAKDKEWVAKVRRELEGEAQEISYDLQFNNIGTGLALSWYYRFLKIKIPKIRDVIAQCPDLQTKFENQKMSHKVFILHPHSCHCPKKISDVDPQVKQVDEKEINLPHIMKATRDYTPTVYCINDADGKENYVFAEFNTQAETLYRMMKEGFIRNESLLSQEWSRFVNKLHTLLHHKDEPMELKNCIEFITYDDKNMQEGDLAQILLNHVRYEITREQGSLPKAIDNGATIEVKKLEGATVTGATGVAPRERHNVEIETNSCARTGRRCQNILTRCFSCCGARNDTVATRDVE